MAIFTVLSIWWAGEASYYILCHMVRFFRSFVIFVYCQFFSFVVEVFSNVFVSKVFLISRSGPWIICILLLSVCFVLLVLLFSVCISSLSVLLILFTSEHFSFIHSSLMCMSLLLMFLCRVIFAVSWHCFCLLFIMTIILSVIHSLFIFFVYFSLEWFRLLELIKYRTTYNRMNGGAGFGRDDKKAKSSKGKIIVDRHDR